MTTIAEIECALANISFTELSTFAILAGSSNREQAQQPTLDLDSETHQNVAAHSSYATAPTK
jgi:hypothetical protein